MSIETVLHNDFNCNPNSILQYDNFRQIYKISDEIVMDGEKGSPCFLGNPSDAPWGANLCDTNVSVCLEKWAGPNAGTIENFNSSIDTCI